jgi:hypothetical protein
VRREFLFFFTLFTNYTSFISRYSKLRGSNPLPVCSRRVSRGGYLPLVVFSSAQMRREEVLLVVFVTQTQREATSPLGVFSSTQTRRDGGNPFSFVFLSTQTRREGFPLLVRSCFYPHRRDEMGLPLLVCVSIHTDAMRGGTPFSFVFLSAQTQREGVPPFLFVFTHTDTTRGVSPLLFVFLSVQTRRDGVYPSCSCFPFVFIAVGRV